MSAKSESSVLEQLKELVKANGNQAAAILDAVIEVLSQGGGGGTVIPGYAGQFLRSDGNGGVVADDKVHLDENGHIRIDDDLLTVKDITSNSNALFNGPFRVSQQDAYFGGKGIATGLVLYDMANPTQSYKVTITNGQLTATLVQ